jgi:hypothetical protein
LAYPYFSRLSSRQQAIYRASDRVGEIRLPDATALLPCVQALGESLAAEDRRAVAAAAAALSRAVLGQFGVPPIRLTVLAVRPSRNWGELHGLYTADEEKPAEIRLWMRTAHHKRVVAFRTFLRTLLHELCHHLDYHVLKLADSLHTEGFFRRESGLFRQLVPTGSRAEASPRSASARTQTRLAVRPQQAKTRQERAVSAVDNRQGQLDFGSDAKR